LTCPVILVSPIIVAPPSVIFKPFLPVIEPSIVIFPAIYVSPSPHTVNFISEGLNNKPVIGSNSPANVPFGFDLNSISLSASPADAGVHYV